MSPAKGDEPRKIVVCHPDNFPEVQRAVNELGHGDVLVKPNKFVPVGQVYVMDGALLRPILAREFGEQEPCGLVHGFFCVLPKGHNMGKADVPENHQPAREFGEGT